MLGRGVTSRLGFGILMEGSQAGEGLLLSVECLCLHPWGLGSTRYKRHNPRGP